MNHLPWVLFTSPGPWPGSWAVAQFCPSEASSASELEESSSASDSDGGEGGLSALGRKQRRWLNAGGHALDSVREDVDELDLCDVRL